MPIKTVKTFFTETNVYVLFLFLVCAVRGAHVNYVRHRIKNAEDSSLLLAIIDGLINGSLFFFAFIIMIAIMVVQIKQEVIGYMQIQKAMEEK